MRQREQCIICHGPAAHGRVCFRYGCGTTARARGWYNAARVLKRQRDEWIIHCHDVITKRDKACAETKRLRRELGRIGLLASDAEPDALTSIREAIWNLLVKETERWDAR